MMEEAAGEEKDSRKTDTGKGMGCCCWKRTNRIPAGGCAADISESARPYMSWAG